MTILLPTTATIADRAAELIATATRRNDTDAIAVLARVCENIAKGAQLRWDMYDLHVTSANRAGVQYTVSCGVCDCPAYKPCWHIAAYEIAIELLDDQAGDADFEADADDPEPSEEPPVSSAPAAAPAPLRLSDYAVRRFILIPALRRTADFLASLRTPEAGPPDIPDEEPPITEGDPEPPDRARTAHGRRLARARSASSYARPLFAERDAETARLAAKGELRAQLEVVQARRQAARVAAQAMNELY